MHYLSSMILLATTGGFLYTLEFSSFFPILLAQWGALFVGLLLFPMRIIASRLNAVIIRDQYDSRYEPAHSDLPTLLLVATSLAMGAFIPWWGGMVTQEIQTAGELTASHVIASSSVVFALIFSMVSLYRQRRIVLS